jgi:DNA-directed RNA polymerase subunit E'
MFKLLTLKSVVRIPPASFGAHIEDAAFYILSEQYNGYIDGDNFIVAVTNILEINDGRILHGDPYTHHPVKFQVLTYTPRLKEVIDGIVVEILDFGAFVRLGPTDGLCHISQVTTDYIEHESMAQRYIMRVGTRILAKGDIVRVKIAQSTMGSGRAGKIGVTMLDPLLGKKEWVDEERAKLMEGT